MRSLGATFPETLCAQEPFLFYGTSVGPLASIFGSGLDVGARHVVQGACVVFALMPVRPNTGVIAPSKTRTP